MNDMGNVHVTIAFSCLCVYPVDLFRMLIRGFLHAVRNIEIIGMIDPSQYSSPP